MSNSLSALLSSKLRLIFAGTPEFAKVILQALIDHQDELNIDIVAVYTQPDRKAGRGQKLTASPVKALAQAVNIPVEQPASFSLNYEKDGIIGQVSRETLANYRPDVMVVAAYGLILPLGVLNTPRLGCINVHASLLPRFRGAAPIQRAILAGDDSTGVTIMQMAQGLDTGDMLYAKACAIDDTDTSASLHDKLADLGGQAIIWVLAELKKYQDKAQKQDEALATYAQKIHSDEGRIDWQQPAKQIQRQIRALNCFAYFKGERIKILSAMPIKDNQTTAEPSGKIIGVGKNAILVACGKNADGVSHLLNITKMQWAGGKPLTAEQIAVGDKLQVGAYFD